ncbi:MAG: MATE family efflux transporter [Deltaproteobacteria bacterium]|jgi:MATE family multidrug resistance protein|nr:MATE family efflux transporter [Deltaproteobacteria bacterium]
MPFFNRLGAGLDALRPARRWGAKMGYREVLALSVPLVASTLASSAMMFTDRLFLARYSLDSIAAALPAGIMKFMLTAFFFGTVTYTGVFAAQYTGAGQHRRAAAALWQGLYLSLLFGFGLYSLYFLGPGIFGLAGHPEELVGLELSYFRVLVLGTPVELMMVTMSSFLSATGRARAVMWVNLAGTALNVPLDYFLIFGVEAGGNALIPPMGVFGAAFATLFSWVFSCALLSFMVFGARMERTHGTRSSRALEWKLMKRIMRYGYPSGIQFLMEIFAFTFFAFAAGRLGAEILAANNIVLSLESMSYIPMIGVGQAVSILVGQSVGRGLPAEGREAAVTGIVLITSYVCIILITFVAFSGPIISVFMPDGTDPLAMARITAVGTVLLRFVVLYSFFDGLYICCFGAIKGAGDVWYPMWAMAVWGAALFVGVVVLFKLDAANIYSLWAVLVSYVLCLTFTGYWRFRSGKWMKLKVIEGGPALE